MNYKEIKENVYYCKFTKYEYRSVPSGTDLQHPHTRGHTNIKRMRKLVSKTDINKRFYR